MGKSIVEGKKLFANFTIHHPVYSSGCRFLSISLAALPSSSSSSSLIIAPCLPFPLVFTHAHHVYTHQGMLEKYIYIYIYICVCVCVCVCVYVCVFMVRSIHEYTYIHISLAWKVWSIRVDVYMYIRRKFCVDGGLGFDITSVKCPGMDFTLITPSRARLSASPTATPLTIVA
jgi:hypothetical protein